MGTWVHLVNKCSRYMAVDKASHGVNGDWGVHTNIHTYMHAYIRTCVHRPQEIETSGDGWVSPYECGEARAVDHAISGPEIIPHGDDGGERLAVDLTAERRRLCNDAEPTCARARILSTGHWGGMIYDHCDVPY